MGRETRLQRSYRSSISCERSVTTTYDFAGSSNCPNTRAANSSANAVNSPFYGGATNAASGVQHRNCRREYPRFVVFLALDTYHRDCRQPTFIVPMGDS